MKKTPVLFLVDHEAEQLLPIVRPGCEWVVAGEGVATIKFDGTACLWSNGQLWNRYDRKLNKQAQRQLDEGHELGPVREDLFKVPPEGFTPCEGQPDPMTFHWPGWVPISATDPADQWHREALAHFNPGMMQEEQTYELVGPSLAKNIYQLPHHTLWPHGAERVDFPDRTFETIETFLTNHDVEGLVFHHPDGRMAKIRRKDFKLFWVQQDTRSARHRDRRLPR